MKRLQEKKRKRKRTGDNNNDNDNNICLDALIFSILAGLLAKGYTAWKSLMIDI